VNAIAVKEKPAPLKKQVSFAKIRDTVLRYLPVYGFLQNTNLKKPAAGIQQVLHQINLSVQHGRRLAHLLYLTF
jgi:hypothetical protein